MSVSQSCISIWFPVICSVSSAESEYWGLGNSPAFSYTLDTGSAVLLLIMPWAMLDSWGRIADNCPSTIGIVDGVGQKKSTRRGNRGARKSKQQAIAFTKLGDQDIQDREVRRSDKLALQLEIANAKLKYQDQDIQQRKARPLGQIETAVGSCKRRAQGASSSAWAVRCHRCWSCKESIADQELRRNVLMELSFCYLPVLGICRQTWI